MVFARNVDDHLTSLVKKLDAEVAKNKPKMAAFVVLLSDDEAAEKKLKELAEKTKNVSLTVDSPAGPPNYKVAKDAAITAVFYKAHKVVANKAFTKDEVNSKAVDAIAADLPKLSSN